MTPLLTRLHAAFADVPHPGDDALTSSFGEEADALREDFRGKNDWRALDAAFLDRAGQGSALAFFTDEALRFYLPAYLAADLEGGLSLVLPEGRLTTFLTEQSEGQRLAATYGGGTMGERARRCFGAFTRPQVEVIVAYLEWKLTQEPGHLTVAQALEHYWRRHPALG